MKSYNYNAVTYNADVYCTGCLPVEAESWPEVYPIFASSEWDYYPNCTVCGETHSYVSLTEIGYDYEAENREF